jgi:HD superfamily phosphohydrolase
VAHLAERLAESIQRKQPLLGITRIDVLCVKIAGLCHDLGHGPYSHLYDGVFIKRMHPQGVHGDGKKWRHEEGSVKMFRHLLEVNKIDLTKYGLSPTDQLFIEEIIGGVEGVHRMGRGPNKFFLYDIVNNTKSGLDVDKLDYYKRDAMMTNVSIQLDPERFIHCVLVMPADPIVGSTYHQDSESISGSESVKGSNIRGDSHPAPELMICYPEKLVSEAVTIFRTRYDLHHLVYQHKAVKAIEYMVSGWEWVGVVMGVGRMCVCVCVSGVWVC